MIYSRHFNLAFLIVASLTLAAGNNGSSCMDRAKTQSAMNACANEEFKAADKRMNELYQQLMRGNHDAKFKAALRKSQRAWLVYRDSVIPVYFPDPEIQYGSVQPMCESQILAELTRKRADELQALLTPADGDVCEANKS